MNYREVKIYSRNLRNNQTPSERILWEQIRDRKLEGFKFIRQHPILIDRQGNELYFFIPDFYCPKARLIIEVDGPVHAFRKEYDRWREEILRSRELRILRFTNEDIGDVQRVLGIIRQAIRDVVK